MTLDLSAAQGRAILLPPLAFYEPPEKPTMKYFNESPGYHNQFLRCWTDDTKRVAFAQFTNFSKADLPRYLALLVQCDLPPESAGILEEGVFFHPEHGPIPTGLDSHGLFLRDKSAHGPRVSKLMFDQTFMKTLTHSS